MLINQTEYTWSKNENLRGYMLVLVALLFSGHAFAASQNRIYAYSFYAVSLCTLVIWLFRRKGKFQIGKKNFAVAIFIVTWICVLFFNFLTHTSTETWEGYVGATLYTIIPCIFAFRLKTTDFGIRFVRIIMALSIISLVCFYFLQHTALFNLLPVMRGSDQFGNIVDKYQGFLVYYRLSPLRNNGPFWEPGIFASYLTLAMLFVNRFIQNKKQRWIYYVVFSITIVSTASTAGYMLLALALICIASYSIAKAKQNSTRILLSLLCVLIVVIAILVFSNLEAVLVQFGVRDQLLFNRLLNISSNERATSITWNWDMFIKNPLFGQGFSGLQALNTQGAGGSTTTSMRLMAALGIGGILYTLMIVRGVFRQKNVSVLTRVVFLLIWMIIVNKEGHDSFVINWMLIYYFNTDYAMLNKDESMAVSIDDYRGV